MLTQHRPHHLRLIRQHDHGLLSGTLASAWAWRGAGAAPDGPPLPFDLVHAVALHDLPWHDFDRTPTLNLATGHPYSFLDLPLPRRLSLYQTGLDQLGAQHPYSGHLVSLHYTTFKGTLHLDDFQTSEAQRRDALAPLLPASPPHPQALPLLKLFDLLSLYVALTPPGTLRDHDPPWLYPSGRGTLPDATPFTLAWRSDDHLTLDPFPFRDPELVLTLPFRDLPRQRYASDAALREAWDRAPMQRWTVRLTP